MVAATPVAVVANPNNKEQRLVLWGNGIIVAYGGAVPVAGPNFVHRVDQQVCQDIHITNWATSAGYVLDRSGAFHEIGGAPEIARDATGTWGNTLGLPYLPEEYRYCGWSWNTNFSTPRGYVIDLYGELFEFGGEPDAPRGGPRFGGPAVKGFAMQWNPDGTKYAITMDKSGALWGDFGATFGTPAAPYFPGRDVTRDLVVTAWQPARGYVLTGDGAAHAWGGAASSLYGGPYRAGRDVARLLFVSNAANPTRLVQYHANGEEFPYVASTPPTVTFGGGQNEVQRVTISGNPTGGTFTLTYAGQTTSALARTATAATVQAALIALSNIGTSDVTVTGAYPVWDVTFTGTLGRTDVAQMTATSSLTGGTPSIAVATTVSGVATSPPPTVTTTTRPTMSWNYVDPQQDAQTSYEWFIYTQTFANANNMTDPSIHKASAIASGSGIDQTVRAVAPTIDLVNGAYRGYVRAKDSAGLWSAWSTGIWTQSVPVPATPTNLTATPNTTTFTTALQVTATAGSATYLRFESSDDGGVTWDQIYGANAIPLTATTTGTDRFPPPGLVRRYRAIAYSVEPRVASLPSSVVTATMSKRTQLLHALDNSALGGEIRVQPPYVWTRPVVVGVHQGLGADFPTVMKDGGKPKGRKGTLKLLTLDAAAWKIVEDLAMSRSTLVFRDQFGKVIYCEITGDWAQELVRAAPTALENTPLRHLHTTPLELTEVKPPVVTS